MITGYGIFFTICLLSYAIRTLFNVLSFKKNPLAENKKFAAFIYVVTAILLFLFGIKSFLLLKNKSEDEK